MAETTDVEWADHTFNLWWGCTEAGPECDHCYARRLAHRFGHDVWGTDKRRWFMTSAWHMPPKWNREAERQGRRARVFCQSMGDIFERLPTNHPDYSRMRGARGQFWRLIEQTPNLLWLLLTKRPGNVMDMVPESWWEAFPDNVHVGTTAGTQKTANANVPRLRRIPAAAHFVSAEPLLERVVLDARWLEYLPTGPDADGASRLLPPIAQVIVGAESGPGARPMHDDWVRTLRDQCIENGVAFFFKQRATPGGRKRSLPVLDGRQWAELTQQEGVT